jgi:hypothetical protein
MTLENNALPCCNDYNLAVAEIHFFLWGVGGGQSLLNFRQNFQISDNSPPPTSLEKTVFNPLLVKISENSSIFREGGGGGWGCVAPAPPRFPPLQPRV